MNEAEKDARAQIDRYRKRINVAGRDYSYDQREEIILLLREIVTLLQGLQPAPPASQTPEGTK